MALRGPRQLDAVGARRQLVVRDPGALERQRDHLRLRLRPAVAVAEPLGQLGPDQVVVARLAGRLEDPPAQLDPVVELLVRLDLEHRGGRQHEVGVGRVRGREAVDDDEQVERRERPPPQRRIGPGGQDRGAADQHAAHRVRLALEDRPREQRRVGLLAHLVVDRELGRADRGAAGGRHRRRIAVQTRTLRASGSASRPARRGGLRAPAARARHGSPGRRCSSTRDRCTSAPSSRARRRSRVPARRPSPPARP